MVFTHSLDFFIITKTISESLMFEKKKLYQNNIDRNERKTLIKSHKEYKPSFFEDLQRDIVCQELFPCCMCLLELCIMFPLSVSYIERLFSRMKLIKLRLRNQFSQTLLDSPLHISTEKPAKFSNDEYKRFVDTLKKLNPKLRLKPSRPMHFKVVLK